MVAALNLRELARSCDRLIAKPSTDQKGKHPMRTVRAALLAGMLLGATVLSSCSSNATETTTTSTTSTTTPPTTTTTTGGGIDEQFGFVRQVAGGALVFDPADMLSGSEAVAAARADGVIGADEDLPNDFYIRNTDATEARSLEVADGAEFLLIGFTSSGAITGQPVSYEQLAALFAGDADSSGLYGFIPGDLPMHLSLSGDTVMGGSQQYLP